MSARLDGLLRSLRSPIALIAAVYFLVLWVTAPSVGFTRDEGYYFKAADEYSRWFGVLFSSRFFSAFSDAEIQRHMSYNTEHPALLKLLQGITYHVFSKWLGIASPAQGYRATGFAFAALSLVATYLLGKSTVSRRVGLLAALLLATTPRYFLDAHLACFDVPITATWTLALVAFHEALRERPNASAGDASAGDASAGDARRRALIAALAFGLALSTKLNALFLPPIFVAVWLLDRSTLREWRLVPGPSGGLDVRLPAIPWVLIACAVIGPLVFVLLWPHLWHAPIQRIGAYITFHLRHEHYPISYFHDLLVKPPFPWSFPVVMTFLTAPSPLVLLGTLGLAVSALRALGGRSRGELLLVLGVFVPVFLIALPSTPIFGGVKHWYNAMPALAVLAARSAFDGVELLWAARSEAWVARARGAVALLAVGPGLAGIIASHPNGIGYYSELAGGYRGGAELGMQRGFWGYLAFPMYRELEALPPGSRVFFNRTNYDSYRMYLREQVFPDRIHYANDAKGAQAGVVFEQPEHAEREGEVWSVLGTRPVDGVYQDEVTLSQLYTRGASSAPPSDAGP